MEGDFSESSGDPLDRAAEEAMLRAYRAERARRDQQAHDALQRALFRLTVAAGVFLIVVGFYFMQVGREIKAKAAGSTIEGPE